MIDNSIVKDLTDNDPKVRLNALSKLHKLSFQDASELLVSMLDEEDYEILHGIIASLIAIGKPALPHLIDGLKFPNPAIQHNSVRILSEIGDATITTSLVNLLKDPDGSVRARALEVLGNIKDVSSLEHIRKLLTDTEPEVRVACVKALANFEDKKSTDKILLLLADRDVDVRIAAAQVLSKFDDPRICEALWQISQQDENPKVREVALDSLKKIGYRVLRCYEDSFLADDVDRRNRVLRELSVFGKALIMPLIELTRHSNPSCREMSANLLGNIGDATVVPYLIAMTSDVEQDVKIAAIRALGKIKSETAISFLISLLKAPDPAVTSVASEVLITVGKDLVKFLPKLLAEHDLNTQITIAQLVGSIGDPEVISMIAQYLEKPQPMWVRRALCFALGETKNPFAADILINKCLKDQETLVRTAAAKALGKLRVSVATEPLILALNDQEEPVIIAAIEALTEIGDRNVGSYLLKFLSSNSPTLKITAIRALAKLNYIGAIPLLKKMTRIWPFSTEPEEIKDEARTALKKLLFESQFLKP
ncbi:MAG: HEAT repeat domain-containing protein [candidate division WOR-3 bacterium]|nr:HEAT repeat domain-containing protein [candidate division WOR-3 bacterium]